MDIKAILSTVDHTLLSTDAAWGDIKDLCDDAMEYQTASICIPPAYAPDAVAYLQGRMPICIVAGFPNGYSTLASKVAETEEAIANGVSEVDMVINVGFLKSGRYEAVRDEIKAVKDACSGRVLKVIIEACLLTVEEKILMCEIITETGADYIKTSTGFSKASATPEDVVLFAKHIGKGVKIKAAGGIRTFEDAQRFLDLGASRLGTSSIVSLIKNQKIAAY